MTEVQQNNITVCAIDVCVNAYQGPLRALVVDVVKDADQQVAASGYFSLNNAVGKTLGYALGAMIQYTQNYEFGLLLVFLNIERRF